MNNFRILPSTARFTQDTPPSPPKKNNVEVWPTHFCSRLNNIDQGGGGGRGHHGAKFAGWVSCEQAEKVQNS